MLKGPNLSSLLSAKWVRLLMSRLCDTQDLPAPAKREGARLAADFVAQGHGGYVCRAVLFIPTEANQSAPGRSD